MSHTHPILGRFQLVEPLAQGGMASVWRAVHREQGIEAAVKVLTRRFADKDKAEALRAEIRARIDIRPGSWPAFWTLGVAGEWPRNGEVDIMEFYRGVILANYAWGGVERFRPHWNSVKIPVSSFNKNWASEFHTWRLDWDAGSMKIYLDGELLNEMDLSVTINESDGKNPFRQSHYILINQALGGDNGGSPADTVFPVRYEVDYVRVYRKEGK